MQFKIGSFHHMMMQCSVIKLFSSFEMTLNDIIPFSNGMKY